MTHLAREAATMRLLRLLAILCCAVPLLAETATTLTWKKKFGGSDYDRVTALTTDAQGNIYLAGTTTSMDLAATACTRHPAVRTCIAWQHRPGNSSRCGVPSLECVGHRDRLGALRSRVRILQLRADAQFGWRGHLEGAEAPAPAPHGVVLDEPSAGHRIRTGRESVEI